MFLLARFKKKLIYFNLLFIFVPVFTSILSMENKEEENKNKSNNLSELLGCWKSINLFRDTLAVQEKVSKERDEKKARIVRLANALKARVGCSIEYTPTDVNTDNQNIIIFLVHGENDKDNFDFSDSQRPIFIAFKKYAQEIANIEKASVSLLSYKWADYCDLEKIDNDSLGLFYLLSEFRDRRVIFIAFDIGGLVVKSTFSKLKERDLNIDIEKIIFLGTPVHEVISENFKIGKEVSILNFYSTGDLWQCTYNKSINQLRKMSEVLKNNKNVYDIRLQIDGKEPIRKDLKLLILKLPEILDILKRYKFHRDLDLNIIMNFTISNDYTDKYKILLAIRGEKNYSDITDVGLSEIKFSNDQKFLYKELYSKEISEKSGIMSLLKNNII